MENFIQIPSLKILGIGMLDKITAGNLVFLIT